MVRAVTLLEEKMLSALGSPRQLLLVPPGGRSSTAGRVQVLPACPSCDPQGPADSNLWRPLQHRLRPSP